MLSKYKDRIYSGSKVQYGHLRNTVRVRNGRATVRVHYVFKSDTKSTVYNDVNHFTMYAIYRSCHALAGV